MPKALAILAIFLMSLHSLATQAPEPSFYDGINNGIRDDKTRLDITIAIEKKVLYFHLEDIPSLFKNSPQREVLQVQLTADALRLYGQKIPEPARTKGINKLESIVKQGNAVLKSKDAINSVFIEIAKQMGLTQAVNDYSPFERIRQSVSERCLSIVTLMAPIGATRYYITSFEYAYLAKHNRQGDLPNWYEAGNNLRLGSGNYYFKAKLGNNEWMTAKRFIKARLETVEIGKVKK